MNIADIAPISREKVKGMAKLKAKFKPFAGKHSEPDADEKGGAPDMDMDDKGKKVPMMRAMLRSKRMPK